MVTGVLVAILLAMAPAAHAAKGMEISLQDESLFVTGQTPFSKPAAYSLLDGIQVSRLRFNAVWISLNNERCQTTKPATPTYNFTRLDTAVAAARAQGLKVLISISGPAPAWANKRKSCDTNSGARINAVYKPRAKSFASFAKLVAQRYAPMGVDEFSIWNEPNHKGWLQPVSTSGSQYRELYRRGYAAIKKVAPKAKVLMGELAPYSSRKGRAVPPLAFLRQMACVNRSYRRLPGKSCPTLTASGSRCTYTTSRAADPALPAARRRDDREPRQPHLRARPAAAGGRVKPTRGSRLNLYLTEYGYFAAKHEGSRAKVFKEKTRAKYLVRAFQIAQRNKRVKQMLQFLLVSYPGSGTSGASFAFDTSIVKGDGTKTRSYTALAKWATRAAEKKLIKPAPTTPYSSASSCREGF